MTEEKILDAIGLIDDDLIEETENLRSRKRDYKKIWIRALSLAACLCIALVGVFGMFRPTSNVSNENYNEAVGEILYGGAVNATFTMGAIQVKLTITRWYSSGFEGVTEDGDRVEVRFTEYTQTNKYTGSEWITIDASPDKEDFPQGTEVEVEYNEWKKMGLFFEDKIVIWACAVCAVKPE